ncbi:L-fuconate dehydratase [Fodinibius salsisoli]|uniref:L-fuconate dehydratase n=1 Tax=Fodinibius salsisoli TaxID=2820877 RepID=A0ABT3PQ06_9BACT|nr:L-fuconate dehydratase [Fodinibius salsisoli]MCW9707916.1 L-fuconate dehydratase [Fodinibius salsisoli]
MTDIIIKGFEVKDIRFPTSQHLDGSDAMNPDPDYSAAYLVLKTNTALEGHGLTFTIGRGNDICVEAVQQLAAQVVDRPFSEIRNQFGNFWHSVARDSQLRWLGPEKGVIHLAMGALVNALWDLYAKIEEKPLWKLLADMSPEELVDCIDFSYITDLLSREEALEILKKQVGSKEGRIQDLAENGYPAYTTSAGWLGYSDDKIRHLCREALEEGWDCMKMKVGSNLQDDLRRAAIIREEIGWDLKLMMDANQKWEVDEAIENMKALAEFDPWWIEEPTNPDDILGHAKIAKAIRPIKVATGEHAHNRVMFKQMIEAGALDICQIDSCRVGGVNENLAIMLMAAKFDIPVCPHAGGVGLCEYVQHLSAVDYIAISGSKENRMIEYVDHLHEHFKDPVQIEAGHYKLPAKPGYSIEMKTQSLQDYSYPEGIKWRNIE